MFQNFAFAESYFASLAKIWPLHSTVATYPLERTLYLFLVRNQKALIRLENEKERGEVLRGKLHGREGARSLARELSTSRAHHTKAIHMMRIQSHNRKGRLIFTRSLPGRRKVI